MNKETRIGRTLAKETSARLLFSKNNGTFIYYCEKFQYVQKASISGDERTPQQI